MTLSEQIASSGICWLILAYAVFVYQQIWCSLLSKAPSNTADQRQSIEQNQQATGQRKDYLAALIAVLPLMGLLGTIIGLLDCFASLATQGVHSELISNSIASALLTTQLGLCCAIPAWLLHYLIRSYTTVKTLSTSGGH